MTVRKPPSWKRSRILLQGVRPSPLPRAMTPNTVQATFLRTFTTLSSSSPSATARTVVALATTKPTEPHTVDAVPRPYAIVGGTSESTPRQKVVQIQPAPAVWIDGSPAFS